MFARLLTVALVACLASVSLALPAFGQLGSVPAKDWIPTLDSPEHTGQADLTFTESQTEP